MSHTAETAILKALPDRLLRKKDVRYLLGEMSESSLWRLLREHPDKLTPLQMRSGLVVFRESQVLAYIDGLPRAEGDSPRTRKARQARALKAEGVTS